ncbi:hypothetical protein [Reichenbachiella versicolor]|uniref:hypothetical protein n=1 Tax=Reichenbachiella versicolor TaxID=1821036 RepID=UPI000D6DEC0B|nr:hypothetical protein [Reichenbachiella versicolor]
MKIKIVTLQAWCNKNITPLAWQRIVIKVLPSLREKGFELEELENPDPNRYFDEEEFKLFSETLSSVYQITFPKEEIENI